MIVVLRESPKREAFADVLFVLRVDVSSISDVDNDSHASFRESQRTTLSFTNWAPATTFRFVSGVLEVGELNPVEGKVFVIEGRAPSFHEPFLEVIVAESITGVGFTLIPDCTARAEWCQCVNHSVVNLYGAAFRVCFLPLGASLGNGIKILDIVF